MSGILRTTRFGQARIRNSSCDSPASSLSWASVRSRASLSRRSIFHGPNRNDA